jgi:hypothetical protein
LAAGYRIGSDPKAFNEVRDFLFGDMRGRR